MISAVGLVLATFLIARDINWMETAEWPTEIDFVEFLIARDINWMET